VKQPAVLLALLVSIASLPALAAEQQQVRLKDLGRLSGWRDNALTGYGIVTGLAGTGDSPRNQATRQSIASMLQNFDVKITPEQVSSRNAAVVMLTAALPPYARRGDTLDVTVTSLGDARSLLGGSLLLAPLKGPDGRVYALAQGAISVGGYKYDLNGNVVQKNHPTVGSVPGGASVEVPVAADILSPQHRMTFMLTRPDYTTAQRAADAINTAIGPGTAFASTAGDIELKPSDAQLRNVVGFVTALESVAVAPDRQARVVINERTGVIVSGGDIHISKVAISFGELRVAITTENSVSQPDRVVLLRSPGVRSVPYANTRVEVNEERGEGHVAARHNTVADLVAALSRMKTPTRDVISILQAVKGAGALHAELIIQ
jgi:flagellar P-ring protein precursor FlgI